jgi:hypothetical protein
MDNFIIGGSVGLNSNFYSTILEKLKKMQSPIKIRKAKLRSKAELYGCFVYINKKLFLKEMTNFNKVSGKIINYNDSYSGEITFDENYSQYK